MHVYLRVELGKNNSLNLTFLGDLSYIKVLLRWLLIQYPVNE